MIMSFKPDWRENVIERLVADDVDTILSAKGEYNDEYFLSEILIRGFKGYNSFTDEELELELKDRDISIIGDNDD